ncbi:MAG: hypothetical protein R3E48_23255 [Burkholderiaceae bacterium]
MKSRGFGRIINISGLAARQTGTIIGSMRNVSVAALIKNKADELAGTGITVTWRSIPVSPPPRRRRA